MASQKSSSLRNRAYRGVTPRFAGWWVALGQGWQILLKHSCVIWKEPQTCEAGRQRYSIPLSSVESTRGACQGEHTWQVSVRAAEEGDLPGRDRKLGRAF